MSNLRHMSNLRFNRLKHLLGSPTTKPVSDKDLPPPDKDEQPSERDLQHADKDLTHTETPPSLSRICPWSTKQGSNSLLRVP